MELRVVTVDAEVLLQPAAGLHRDGALLNHQMVASCAGRDSPRHQFHRGKVRLAILERRSAHADKDHLALRQRVFDPGNELQPPRLPVALDQVP